MADHQDPAMANQPPPATPAAANAEQLEAHRRTFDRMIGMFKYLIIAVAFILLGLLVFLR
jgi:hypothetical protein